MKLTQVTVLGLSALFSLSTFAAEPTATKTETTPVAKAEGHTCEQCTKEGKECECKGECKCGHKEKHHNKHHGKKGTKAGKTAATPATPATPATADATTTETKTEDKK